MTAPLPPLRQARTVALSLCLFATVYMLVLLMAQGVASAMPPLMVLGLILVTATPFLAYLALGLITRRVARGGTPPRGLMLALAVMMAVPALFWGLSFASHLGQALSAGNVAGFIVAAVMAGIPTSLAAWLALAFLRLGARARGVA